VNGLRTWAERAPTAVGRLEGSGPSNSLIKSLARDFRTAYKWVKCDLTGCRTFLGNVFPVPVVELDPSRHRLAD